jgi:methionyl-tRNA formyltransferase
MQMEEGLDTGPVWLSRQTMIEPSDNFQTLHDRLALMGAQTICDFFRQWASESRSLMTAIPQPSEGVTYAHKISKHDTLIRWNQSAQKVFHQIRALSPSPGATAQLGAQSIKIFEALPLDVKSSHGLSGPFKPGEVIQANAAGLHVACESGAVSLLSLQKAGGKRLGYREFLNGQPLRSGDIFVAEPKLLTKPEPSRPAAPQT